MPFQCFSWARHWTWEVEIEFHWQCQSANMSSWVCPARCVCFSHSILWCKSRGTFGWFQLLAFLLVVQGLGKAAWYALQSWMSTSFSVLLLYVMASMKARIDLHTDHNVKTQTTFEAFHLSPEVSICLPQSLSCPFILHPHQHFLWWGLSASLDDQASEMEQDGF